MVITKDYPVIKIARVSSSSPGITEMQWWASCEATGVNATSNTFKGLMVHVNAIIGNVVNSAKVLNR